MSKKLLTYKHIIHLRNILTFIDSADIPPYILYVLALNYSVKAKNWTDICTVTVVGTQTHRIGGFVSTNVHKDA